jgi:hypothetical protein
LNPVPLIESSEYNRAKSCYFDVIAKKVPSPEPSPLWGEGNHNRELLSPGGGEDEGEGARAGSEKTFMPMGLP